MKTTTNGSSFLPRTQFNFRKQGRRLLDYHWIPPQDIHHSIFSFFSFSTTLVCLTILESKQKQKRWLQLLLHFQPFFFFFLVKQNLSCFAFVFLLVMLHLPLPVWDTSAAHAAHVPSKLCDTCRYVRSMIELQVWMFCWKVYIFKTWRPCLGLSINELTVSFLFDV